MEEQGNGSKLMFAVFLALGVVMFLFMLLASGEAMAMHNREMAELVFSDKAIPEELNDEEKAAVIFFKRALVSLESAYLADEGEVKPDLLRVQAFFYALFFGELYPEVSVDEFYKCFQFDTEGVPYLEQVYARLETLLHRPVTEEEIINASELYYRLCYGFSVPSYGTESEDWINNLPGNTGGSGVVDGEMCSPIKTNWKSVISSEFGKRQDPITGKIAGHGGIDFRVPSGSAVFSVWDGTVQAVRYAGSGYGYHVVINHGNGVMTLYAHCSKLLVIEGQQVLCGDVIALSGNTGKSTGPHLHFEIRINGEQKDPSIYLP